MTTTLRLHLALGLALAMGAAAAPAQGPMDERARIRADYKRELDGLRLQHQLMLGETRKQVALMEQKIGTLRRLILAQAEADAVEGDLQSLARAAGVPLLETKRVAGSERIRLANGEATPYERFMMEVAGEANHVSVGRFLDRVAAQPATVELLTLTLDAGPAGTGRFAARLAYPVHRGWPEPAPPPPAAPAPPEGTYASLAEERDALQLSIFEHRDYFRRAADVAREPIRRMQAEVFAISEMRTERSPSRFHRTLSRLGAGMAGRKVALTRARLDGGRATIEGIAFGASARAALRPAIEGAGLVVETLDVAPGGDCGAFSLVARLASREASEDVAPSADRGPYFDHRPAATCDAPVQPAKGSVVARGTSGDLTMRLRDADLADVFQLLVHTTQASFVIDADVQGRVDVDLQRATLEEALAAMSAAGVTVGQGRLRRVSRAAGQRMAPPAAAESSAPPVSLFFKNGLLIDILRLFEEISGSKVWTAPILDGRVSIFANEMPWDLALHGLAASVGLTAVIEPDRIFVGPAAMAKAPWTSGAVEVTRAKSTDAEIGWGAIRDARGLSPEDLKPVGWTRTSDGVQGVVYGPGRVMFVLQSGVLLLEASVEAVDTTGLTLATKDGRKIAVRFAP